MAVAFLFVAGAQTQDKTQARQVPRSIVCRQPLSSNGEATLRQALEAVRLATLGNERLALFAEQAAKTYEASGNCLLWNSGGKPTAAAEQLMAQLANAADKGLDPSDYDGHVGTLQIGSLARPECDDETGPIRFDVALTVAAVRYVSDLHRGRANPDTKIPSIVNHGNGLELAKFIQQEIADATNIRSALEAVEPPFQTYRRTLSALAAYRELLKAAAPFTFSLPPYPIEPGIPYKDAPQLRETLHSLGDLPSTESQVATMYDLKLAEAVIRFQQRHGLEPNGRLDAATIRELNTPLAKRVKQLELALERWRWLPPTYSGAPIVVNIPEFRLHMVDEEHHIAASMNVVVGRAYRHETPVFRGTINSILFRPPWNVPLEIQRRELVPLIEEDPDYLEMNSYDILDGFGAKVSESLSADEISAGLKEGRFFLRQRPGPDNSLGLIKFDLPNPYNIYLHGTPAQELFSKARRDFSHGCVRVEDPVALAVWLLRANPGWTRERIESAMHGEETLRVALVRPVPLWIVYGTAVVLEDGRIRFLRDVYGQDAELQEELDRLRREERLSP